MSEADYAFAGIFERKSYDLRIAAVEMSRKNCEPRIQIGNLFLAAATQAFSRTPGLRRGTLLKKGFLRAGPPTRFESGNHPQIRPTKLFI